MMRLHQTISESNHPDKLVDLTLGEIIAAGKVTNPYQTYVLSSVAEAVKNANGRQVYLEGPVTYTGGGTSTESINAIKALSDADSVKLAQYLLDCLQAGGTLLSDQQMKLNDWTAFVLARQSN